MAGSFNVFRRYEKASLAALAILAMLAFFVLPPVLQMGGSGPAAGNGVAVTWRGGSLRERDLGRAVGTRRALNQFLVILRSAAVGSDRVPPPLPEDEKSVVGSLLLAREAAANGLMVSDAVVNDFLAAWTGERVSAEKIREVIDDLRNRVGVTEQEIFDALRTFLLGERMEKITLQGLEYAGAPAGWRWDAFRRLEQSATVEVVPVSVAAFAKDVAPPSAAALRDLYERHARELPRASRATPGFREAARIKFDAVMAAPDLFLAECEAAVTEEQIAKFYEENRDGLFKKAPPAADAGEGAAKPGTEGADDVGRSTGDAEAGAGTTSTEGPAKPDAPADRPPAGPPQATPEAPADDGAAAHRGPIRTAAFRRQAEAAPEPAAAPQPAAESGTAGGEPAATTGADPGLAAVGQPADATHEPLEKVRDEIRGRLAREAADRKVGEIFLEIRSRIDGYADELNLSVVPGNPVPTEPDVEQIAAAHGLQAISAGFVDAEEARGMAGIGASSGWPLSAQFRVSQEQPWVAIMFFIFAPNESRWRPAFTRDAAGSRYLSWKTGDRPESSPPFAEVREKVEDAWRNIEARPLARKRAEEIAAAATDGTLAAVAGRDGLEVTTVGPFTWLTRGLAPAFGAAPVLSQPDGLQMPGEDFMRAVFALEPGGTAVAFNEPRTICYAIRLAAYEPAEETLRERFVDATTDPRRLRQVVDDEANRGLAAWAADLEKRHDVQWKRDPR